MFLKYIIGYFLSIFSPNVSEYVKGGQRDQEESPKTKFLTEVSEVGPSGENK